MTMGKDTTSDGKRSLRQYGQKKSTKNVETFLAVLRKGRTVASAAAAIGIARRTAFEWKADDPEFHKAWTDAVEEGTDRLEEEAHRRAVEGVPGRPWQSKEGDIVQIQEYSDTLMTLMLKGKRPHVYGDTTKHVGPDGGAIKIERVEHVIIDPPKTIK